MIQKKHSQEILFLVIFVHNSHDQFSRRLSREKMFCSRPIQMNTIVTKSELLNESLWHDVNDMREGCLTGKDETLSKVVIGRLRAPSIHLDLNLARAVPPTTSNRCQRFGSSRGPSLISQDKWRDQPPWLMQQLESENAGRASKQDNRSSLLLNWLSSNCTNGGTHCNDCVSLGNESICR